jgi:hypothetical protein
LTLTKTFIAIFTLLGVESQSYAGPCASLIAGVQAKVDAAIEKHAGSDGWKRESVGATLGHQPTPHSLAATEGYRGQDFEVALDSLDRARAADRVGRFAACRHDLAVAKAVVGNHSH